MSPNPQVHAPGLDLRLDVARGGFMHAHGESREVAGQGLEYGRHPGYMERRNHPDVHAAAEQRVDVVDRRAGLFRIAQHDFGASAKRHTCFGEEYALADAAEQRRAQQSLELRDLL